MQSKSSLYSKLKVSCTFNNIITSLSSLTMRPISWYSRKRNSYLNKLGNCIFMRKINFSCKQTLTISNQSCSIGLKIKSMMEEHSSLNRKWYMCLIQKIKSSLEYLRVKIMLKWSDQMCHFTRLEDLIHTEVKTSTYYSIHIWMLILITSIRDKSFIRIQFYQSLTW